MDKTVELVFFAARKATLAFLAAGVGALGTSMLDGVLTGQEAVAALGVGAVAAATVYGFGNKPRV